MYKAFRKYLRIWAFCLAALFASYYATTALFAHVHVVNGVMLVHSHPFTKSHSHNDGQALALHFLSSFHSLEAGYTDIEIPNLYVLCSLVEMLDVSLVVSSCTTGIFLRAPPVL